MAPRVTVSFPVSQAAGCLFPARLYSRIAIAIAAIALPLPFLCSASVKLIISLQRQLCCGSALPLCSGASFAGIFYCTQRSLTFAPFLPPASSAANSSSIESGGYHAPYKFVLSYRVVQSASCSRIFTSHSRTRGLTTEELSLGPCFPFHQYNLDFSEPANATTSALQ